MASPEVLLRSLEPRNSRLSKLHHQSSTRERSCCMSWRWGKNGRTKGLLNLTKRGAQPLLRANMKSIQIQLDMAGKVGLVWRGWFLAIGHLVASAPCLLLDPFDPFGEHQTLNYIELHRCSCCELPNFRPPVSIMPWRGC